ncbi:MAG: tetratricopeptide repeat protein [Methanobrevibacter sp.]|nr:tetratricopeptide repeat protein [Methanobrevibacter sp.]
MRLADKILKIYPEDSDTLKVKLNASFYLKKYEIALETSEKIIKAYPDFHAANAFRADILKELGRTKEAFIGYNKAIVDFPDDFGLESKTEDLIDSLDYGEDSIEFLQELIKENPNNTFAYLAIGYSYNRLSKHEDALEYFDKHIQQVRKYKGHSPGSHIYLQKSETLRALKRYDEAMEIINKTIEIEGDFTENFIEKGLIYKELGEYDKAVSLFDKAIEVDPDYSHPISEKAMLYFEIEQYDKAIEYFEEYGSDGSDCDYHMGLALKHEKEYDKALECFNGIEDGPYTQEIFLKAQKEIEEIKKIIEK